MITPLLVLALSATAQVAPTSQPGLKAEAAGPFSFYLVPSDEIGFKDCPQAFQITFDGDINNGFGELDFAAGAELKPINQRVKTLLKDYLPVVEYSFERDGVRYAVESFAAPNKLDPRENLVAFTRVTVSNPGKEAAHAVWEAAYRPRGTTARSDLGCRRWYQQKFTDGPVFGAGRPMNASLVNGTALVNDHLVFEYSGSPVVQSQEAAVRYEFDLKPGERQTIEFKQPFVPVSSNRPAEVSKVSEASYDQALQAVTAFWEGLLGRALNVELDDPKVVDTMKASLIYDLMARDIEADGKHFTQTVNKFQYHGFFPRDTSFIARSYELLNLEDTARETIEKYLVRDQSGAVKKFLRIHPDDWGQSLWALGSYFRTTGDVGFAKEVAPALPGHLDEFEDVVAHDPLGLWKVAGPYDNELINGHYTSHNLWALLGLEEAENIARAAGDEATALRAQTLRAKFKEVFLARLKPLTDADGGYMPPGMDDTTSGNDWENASAGVYPFHVFAPHDTIVDATVGMEHEYKYREGIMTWGPNAYYAKLKAEAGKPLQGELLHDYVTYQLDETLLTRNDQEKVVQDLYSTLVHTSSTHGGFETSIEPWGNRDPDGNYPPHGWFAARYNELVRNMLLREEGDSLVLLSAVAPDWIKPGKRIKVARGANSFGSLDFQLDADRHGADLKLDGTWRQAPKSLVVHVPWFVKVQSVTIDGTPYDGAGNTGVVVAPATARNIHFNWTWTSHPDLSYRKAVQLWLRKNYEPKPGEDRDHLFPTLVRPGLVNPQTTFLDHYQLGLVSRFGSGKVHFTLDGTQPTASSPEFKNSVAITDSCEVRAVEVLPDGSTSEELRVKLTKAVPSPAVQADVKPGISYRYYEGDITKMPDFSTLSPTRAGVATLPDLDTIAHRKEVFAIQADGYVRVSEDGLYGFITGSDDGSKLWIDDQLVVDNDGPHAYTELEGLVALKAGLHKIHIEYFDAGDANYLHLLWERPGHTKEAIPASAWFHG